LQRTLTSQGLLKKVMLTEKQDLLKYLGELPDDATLEDIEYYLYVRRKIEHSRAALTRGEFISQEEVERRMKEWSETLSGRSRR
jgi:hypothetical protein